MVEQRKAEAAAAPGPSGLRDLSLTLAVAAGGCVGAAGSAGPADPTALLIWLAIYAPAAGFLLGALGVRPWLFAPAAPGLWMVTLVLLDIAAQRDLPTPLWGALAWTGLFAAGLGLGRRGAVARGERGQVSVPARSPARALGGAGALLLLTAALVALPGKGGRAREPWPPAAARALLDLSPATLVVESAGVDWMRHRAVYEPVRSDRFQRLPYRGALAGPLALVVGCLVALGAGYLVRAPGGAED